MRKTEALKFIKRIIEMGKEKGQSTKTIKTNIETYIDILVSDNTIDAETEKTLRNVVKNIKGIVNGKSSVDQVDKKEKVLLEKKRVSPTSGAVYDWIRRSRSDTYRSASDRGCRPGRPAP